jgi:putative toxin-antitoxin system antitoxin component (TIGR02293 family)
MGILTVLPSNSELDLGIVESGVPLSALADFLNESGLRTADIYEVVLPARTLKHRKARNENLSIDESDRFARLVRVFNQAMRVFGAKDHATHWLNAPKKRFTDRTPIQMLRTEVGGRMVEEMLGQIEYGMFA